MTTRELCTPGTMRESRSDSDGHTIEGIAVPWNRPTQIGPYLREQFAPGAIDPNQAVGRPLRWRHDEPIGVVTSASNDADGLRVTARVAHTRQGADALALLRELPDLGMSVRFVETDTDADGDPVTVRAADLIELSLTDVPAYPDAVVTATREKETMESAPVAVVDAPETPDLSEDLSQIREQVAALTAARLPSATTDANPLSKYRSMGEYAIAVYRGEEQVRALADNLSSESPGLVTDSWVRDIKGIVDRGRPFLSALGVAPLPSSGMEVHFPYYDGTLTALVGAQSTEKTEITSAKVSFKDGSQAIATYAGGSDISLQVIERSDPAYLDGFLRVMSAAFARVTENAGALAAEAAAGQDFATLVAADPETLFQAVVAAQAHVLDATGQPLDVLVCDPASWATWAAALDADNRPMYGAYNPTNAGGKPLAPGVSAFDVAGVPVVRGTTTLTAEFVGTNSAAFRWHEDGPRTLAADEVAKLGRDVAVYGYGAPVAYLPEGIVTLTISS